MITSTSEEGIIRMGISLLHYSIVKDSPTSLECVCILNPDPHLFTLHSSEIVHHHNIYFHEFLILQSKQYLREQWRSW